MRALLGDDYAAFAATLDAPAFRGVYINTLKCSKEKFLSLFPYPLTPTPFSSYGFYIDPAVEGLGRLPLHHAGAFYAQEPSAMSAAAALAVRKGDKVLDLCAAPGGKTTALAAALDGTGLLWSNEYVKKRAFTLLSNIERIGARNVVVSNTGAQTLAAQLPAFFDKILVDAPCSGEGMLRREKAVYEDWNENNILLCAERQKEILTQAAKLLRPGGEMVYSTCTFNQTENEDVAQWFLEHHPDFSLLPIAEDFGSPGFGMPDARRIFPRDGGEGHFVVKFKKAGEAPLVKFKDFTGTAAPEDFFTFYQSVFEGKPYGKPTMIGGKIYLLPADLPATEHCSILRAGVLAGEMQGKRFSPAHALFSAAREPDIRNGIDLAANDERLQRFLHGEEIDIGSEAPQKGYYAVSVKGIPLGFGKVSGAKMKNHYPKGLRNLTL